MDVGVDIKAQDVEDVGADLSVNVGKVTLEDINTSVHIGINESALSVHVSVSVKAQDVEDVGPDFGINVGEVALEDVNIGVNISIDDGALNVNVGVDISVDDSRLGDSSTGHSGGNGEDTSNSRDLHCALFLSGLFKL